MEKVIKFTKRKQSSSGDIIEIATINAEHIIGFKINKTETNGEIIFLIKFYTPYKEEFLFNERYKLNEKEITDIYDKIFNFLKSEEHILNVDFVYTPPNIAQAQRNLQNLEY
jgi:hypothetical protein